jgi:lipopolysaccharide export system protein LptA
VSRARSRWLRRVALAVATPLAVAAPLAVVPAAASAQGRGQQCPVVFEPRTPGDSAATVLEKQFTGTYNAFQGGGVRYRCQGDDVTIEADSSAYYGDLNILYMIGNVRYRDGRATLDSDRLTYYRNEEWVIVEGNVFARMEDGSTMRGPAAEYFRAMPGIRPLQRVAATGRPVLTLVQRDSAGAEQEPVTVVADRVTAEGDSLVYAGGQVNITRTDVFARADSAALDQGREYMRLMRSPQIDGRGDRPFTMLGQVIELFSRERELERVLATQQARVISEDVTVFADSLDLRVVEGDLQQAYAWGPGRARATSPGRVIEADSLDVRLPGQRLQEVHAIGAARLESDPDSTEIVSTARDWLEGDTVVARFDTLRAPGDTSTQASIRELVSRGRARSYQQIPPDTGRTSCPAIHYVSGRMITVTFENREAQLVRVLAPDSGVASGAYLEAPASGCGASAGGTPSAPAPVPAGSPPPPPPPLARGVRDE